MKLSILISDENSQRSPKSDASGNHFGQSGLPLSLIRILNSVALIQEIKSFGYTSNDDVKERYHSCMMKGKYEKICELICKKVSDKFYFKWLKKGIVEIGKLASFSPTI